MSAFHENTDATDTTATLRPLYSVVERVISSIVFKPERKDVPLDVQRANWDVGPPVALIARPVLRSRIGPGARARRSNREKRSR